MEKTKGPAIEDIGPTAREELISMLSGSDKKVGELEAKEHSLGR